MTTIENNLYDINKNLKSISDRLEILCYIQFAFLKKQNLEIKFSDDDLLRSFKCKSQHRLPLIRLRGFFNHLLMFQLLVGLLAYLGEIKMNYFELPTGYNCLQVSSTGSQVTARSSNYSDTYILNGFKWVQVDRVYYNGSYHSNSCTYNYTDKYFVPPNLQSAFVLPATIIVLAFFTIIYKMFMGIRRR